MQAKNMTGKNYGKIKKKMNVFPSLKKKGGRGGE